MNMKVICTILLFFVVSPLFAQQAGLDTVSYLSEVLIVGDKSKSIPGSGQYIGSRKIAMLNQPNINQVLRTVPGVNIRDEEGFGLRPNIGLRGTPVNRSAKSPLWKMVSW